MAERISREQLFYHYRLTFPTFKPVDFQELMDKFASSKGFSKDHGRPDDSRGARYILKVPFVRLRWL